MLHCHICAIRHVSSNSCNDGRWVCAIYHVSSYSCNDGRCVCAVRHVSSYSCNDGRCVCAVRHVSSYSCNDGRCVCAVRHVSSYSCNNRRCVCIVVKHSESQSRADSPDASRPKTLQLDQSSTQPRSSGNTAGIPANSGVVPSHLKTRRSLATESVS